MSWIRSPSLANSSQHNPQAVGACFDECSELPLLLARAVVGSVDHRATLCVYRLLSKGFRDGVRDATQEWMVVLADLQKNWIASGLDDASNLDYTILARMSERMDVAFGAGFSQGYQENTLMMSCHTPRAYMSMLGRRCMICNEAMTLGPKKKNERTPCPLFCFAHPHCQAQFTVVLSPKPLSMGRVQREPSWVKQKIAYTCDIQPSSSAYARLVDLLSKYHHDFPATLSELKTKLTPYTQHVNARSNGALTVWVGDPRIDTSAWVKPADTLLGMLNIGATEIAKAKETHAALARSSARERADRAQKRHELNTKRRREREGDLRLALGRPHSPIQWRSVEALAALHPSALETVGCIDYFSGGMEITLEKLLHRIRFLQYLLQGIRRPLSGATVGYLFMQPSLFNLACPSNTAAPYSPKLLRFLDAIDHLAPNDNCYEIERVRRPISSQRDHIDTWWRLHANLTLYNGRVKRPVGYVLRESEIRLAEAKLRNAGLAVKSFPKSGDCTTTNMAEYVRDVIDCSFKTRDHRLIGYELLGLTTAGVAIEIASCLDMEGHAHHEPGVGDGEMLMHAEPDPDDEGEANLANALDAVESESEEAWVDGHDLW